MEITKKLFFSNIIFYFIGIVIGGMINFFSIPLIIEKYGVENYGQFSLIQNIILIIISFGSGWLNQNILRFNDNSTKFKVVIIKLYYIFILPITIISLFTILLLSYNLIIASISAITVAIGGLTAIINTFYQSTFNAKKNVFFDIFRVLGFVILVYIFSINLDDNAILYLVLSFFVSYVIAFILKLKADFSLLKSIFHLFIKDLSYAKIKAFLQNNKSFIDYGLPLSLWFTFASILNVGDRYIINLYLSKEEVGNYSAIYDLIYKAVSISFTPILSAGYPIISKFYNSGQPKKAFNFIKKLILFELALLFLAIILSIYFNEFFLEKLARVGYSDINKQLVLLIVISAIVWQIAMLVHKPLELKLQTRKMLYFVAIALGSNITINLLFVPTFGVIVSAYASIACVTLYLFLCITCLFKNDSLYFGINNSTS